MFQETVTTSNTTSSSSFLSNDNIKVPQLLWTYVSPFLFLAGLSGNILSLIVLNRPPIRKSAISLALRLIAFFDCIILVLGLTRHWTKYALKYDIRNSNSAFCKTHMFLVYSALDSSVWNLAALNVGRLIAVQNPLKANLIFTQRRIWLAAFVITGCAMALNSHVFITRGVSHSNSTIYCGYTSEAAEIFWKDYLPYIVLLIYVLGPFVSFSICNTIIIVKVHQEIEGKCKNQGSQHQDSTARSLTVMLVAASFTFLLLTTPNVILDFLRTTHADEPAVLSRSHLQGHVTMAVVDVICTLGLYINHSLSFYTYLLSGTRFRHEAAVMFCPKLIPRRDVAFASSSHSAAGELTIESRRQSTSAIPYSHCMTDTLSQQEQKLLKEELLTSREAEKLPDLSHNGRPAARIPGQSVSIIIEPQYDRRYHDHHV